MTKQKLLRLLNEEDALKKPMQTLPHEVTKAEMDEALRAGVGERTAARLGYRGGDDPRALNLKRLHRHDARLRAA